MMPDGNLEMVASYTAHAPSAVVLQTACPVWVYWLAPDSEPEGAEFDLECEPEGGLVFVAASPDQVPEDAQPVRGHLSCPGAEEHGRELLGDSVGPYYLHHSAVSAQDGDASSPGCLLARLSIQMKDGQAPPMFRYEERDPPPLAERCRELSGCELQRLAGCPVVVGDLRPTALPPLELRMATSCCGCGFPGAKLTINGRDTADFEQEGHVKLRRRRHGGHLEVQVEGVPAQLLAEVPSLLPYKALGPQVMRLDLVCPLWVYWVPPEAGSADEVNLDADGMIFLASDSSQVPEEALPVRGSLGCRGVEEIELDGTSVGPFLVRRAPLPVSTFSSTLAEMRSISKNNLGFGLEGAGGDAIDATPQATPRATPRGTGRMSLARGPASPGGPGGSTSSRSPRRIQRTSTAAFALTRFRREAASKEANEDEGITS
ncbi:unnamed protein product [Prorocentrum cordatum]|uniref:Anaphase-promoting complex subunit 1 n=1 Tax=Prorocentrum cordatum TaxID=2364126 RepID=A0ABN9VPP7_9DINO|nr:unnamed protein product [Polarella glacialis]